MTFDPNIVDTRKLAANLAALARKWFRKPTVKRNPAKKGFFGEGLRRS